MSKIGIGIVTFNRLEYLKRVVEGVRKHTKSDYQLVVAEDGGDDGTREWCAQEGIRVVSGQNGGVCWNKNRALFALQSMSCDPILLLEDDCIPVKDHWELDWKISTALFGHLAFAHPKIDPWIISGSGTPTDPIVNNKATAQCSSVSGIALAEVGYFDTRFKGYGVGHAEWTTRLKRAGYGFRDAVDATGKKVKANLYIKGGLHGDDAPTFKDRANVARNEELFTKLKSEPIYRDPWFGDEEKARFLQEMAVAKVDIHRHERIVEDAQSSYPEIRTRHLKSYAKAFKRLFGEPRSFMKSSGWLSSIALNIPACEGEVAPWLNYSVIEFLKERVQPQWRVFEYGAGYSTVWWSSKVSEVVSAEQDAGWAGLLRTLCEGRSVQILEEPAEEAFPQTIDQVDGSFDVIVIDGADRPGCVQHATGRLASDGVLMLNNTNRAELAQSIAELKAAGFKELRLRGPAPMTYIMETTSFFYRTENCFGL